MCSNGDNNKVISSYTYIYQTILTILPTCKPVRTSTDTRTDHGVNIWRAHAYACMLQYYDVFDLVNVRLGAGGRWRTRDDDACLPVPRGANSSIHAYLSVGLCFIAWQTAADAEAKAHMQRRRHFAFVRMHRVENRPVAAACASSLLCRPL